MTKVKQTPRENGGWVGRFTVGTKVWWVGIETDGSGDRKQVKTRGVVTAIINPRAANDSTAVDADEQAREHWAMAINGVVASVQQKGRKAEKYRITVESTEQLQDAAASEYAQRSDQHVGRVGSLYWGWFRQVHHTHAPAPRGPSVRAVKQTKST